MQNATCVRGPHMAAIREQCRGRDLVQTMLWCVYKREGHLFFWPPGSEMSGSISLRMGLKLAASLNMGKDLC